MSALGRAFNIADLRRLARRGLPRGIFEFIDRGTEDEVSLRENRAAFERIKLRPARAGGRLEPQHRGDHPRQARTPCRWQSHPRVPPA